MILIIISIGLAILIFQAGNMYGRHQAMRYCIKKMDKEIEELSDQA